MSLNAQSFKCPLNYMGVKDRKDNVFFRITLKKADMLRRLATDHIETRPVLYSRFSQLPQCGLQGVSNAQPSGPQVGIRKLCTFFILCKFGRAILNFSLMSIYSGRRTTQILRCSGLPVKFLNFCRLKF